MSSHVAYLLVFHGSHDPRSQQAAKTLTQAFQQAIQQTSQIPHAVGQVFSWESTTHSDHSDSRSSPLAPSTIAQQQTVWVQDAYLECFPLPLHQQITQFVEQAQAAIGHEVLQKIVVLPVFLLAGTHVKADIPAEIALAQTLIGETPTLQVTPHFGSHVGLQRIITERMAAHPLEAWILLAHGSRYPGANQAIEAIANAVGAIEAYWSTAPKLDTQVQELASAGFRKVGIFPYFLSSGAITEAIAQQISQLSQQWPQLSLTLTPPLEANQELAHLLSDFAQKAEH